MENGTQPAAGAGCQEHEETPADSRRGARQIALQALYWAASTRDDPRDAVRELGERSGHGDPVRAFSLALVEAVTAHEADLDALIRSSGTRWSLERMARVDLLILRLGLAEILYVPEVPIPVSIDEAVEMARIFSTGDSYAFVNGVLDAIVQQHNLL